MDFALRFRSKLRPRIVLSKTFVHQKAMMAAGSLSLRIKGLPDSMDPTRPQKVFWDAVQRENAQEWAEALNKEYMGFKQHYVFRLVLLQKGMKLMGMTTRREYTITKVVLDKDKTRL